MIGRYCKASLQILLLSLLSAAGYALPADSLSAPLKASFSVSATRLMQQVFNPGERGGLIAYDDAEDLQQQYVNGAVPLYDNTVKNKLVTSIQQFNNANKSNKIKLFAFTGRYYLGYTDAVRDLTLDESGKKIMDALSAGLQKENNGKGSREIFRREFLKVLDDKYEEFRNRSSSEQMEKTIVFFYVEAVLGHDYLRDKTPATIYRKRHYCFVWTRGLDAFETRQLNETFPAFRQLIKLTQNGLSDPGALASCVDKVTDLYNHRLDYDNPEAAIRFVWSLSADERKSLSIAERMRLLRAMNKANLKDVNNLLAIALGAEGAYGEDAVLQVMNTTPGGGDADQLLDSLITVKQGDELLLVSLYNKLNDKMIVGFGNSNRSGYLKALTQLIETGNRFEQRFTDLLNENNIVNRCIHWDPSYIADNTPPVGANQYDISMGGDGTISVARSYVTSHKVDWVMSGTPREEAPSSFARLVLTPQYGHGTPYTLQPLDLVLIFNNSGLGSLASADIPQGAVVIVPAIALKLIREKEFNSDLLTAVAVAADAASILTGPGRLASAASRTRRAWVMFEMANAFSNLLLNANKSELQGSRFETVVEYSNLVVVAIGGYELLSGTVKAVPQAFQVAQNLSNALKQELAVRFVAAVMRVEAELAELKNVKQAEQILILKDKIIKEWKAKNVDLVELGGKLDKIDVLDLYRDLATTIKNRVLARIAQTENFAMKYTDEQLLLLTAKGKQLGLEDDVIEGFIYIGCRTEKQIGAVELARQMDNWVKIVKKYGYPFKFDNLEQFLKFKTGLKDLLKKYGIPTDDVRFQGSALRTEAAKDIDVGVFVSEADFERIVERAIAGFERRVANEGKRKRFIKAIMEQKADGRLNSFYLDRIDDSVHGTFNNDLFEGVLKPNSAADAIDLSIMVAGRKFDTKPFLK